MKYDITKDPPTIPPKMVAPLNSVEFNQASMLSISSYLILGPFSSPSPLSSTQIFYLNLSFCAYKIDKICLNELVIYDDTGAESGFREEIASPKK